MNTQSSKITQPELNKLQQSLAPNNFASSPAILAVSNDGMILECNKIGEKILDFPKKPLKEVHISMLLPQLKKIDLLEKNGERVNPYLRFLSRIGRNFKVISMNGKQFSSELYFSDINFQNRHQIIIMIYPTQQESALRSI